MVWQPLCSCSHIVLHASHVKSNCSEVLGCDFRACLVCVSVEAVLFVLLLISAWMHQRAACTDSACSALLTPPSVSTLSWALVHLSYHIPVVLCVLLSPQCDIGGEGSVLPGPGFRSGSVLLLPAHPEKYYQADLLLQQSWQSLGTQLPEMSLLRFRLVNQLGCCRIIQQM